MAFSKKIPDRWEDYEPMGKPVLGTRFIAFKVPLKESLCERMPDDLRFTPNDLLQETKNGGINVGLVIDLTNTTRYYNPKVFHDAGIEYKKIFTAGKVVPSPDVKMDFLSTVDDFIERHPDEDVLVGVHCTHGLNRTGHLVCRYMIDRLNIEPDTAIESYNEARGHKMERENYIEDLKTCPTDMEEYKKYRSRQAEVASEEQDPTSSNTNQNNQTSVNQEWHQPRRRDWSNHGYHESDRYSPHDAPGRQRYEDFERKGPGSGWSLPNDGQQNGRGLSHDRQVENGLESEWSRSRINDDGYTNGRGMLNDGQVYQQRGPGSGWSLEPDTQGPSNRHYTNDPRPDSRRIYGRGRGSGWSLPDDRQQRYDERDSRPYSNRSYNGQWGESDGSGYSRGRFRRYRGGGRHGNYDNSSARGGHRSGYNGDNGDRSRPYHVRQHYNDRDKQV